MMKHHLILACAAAFAAPLASQAVPAPFTTHAANVESGWLTNDAATARTLFSTDVQVRGAAWLRLHLTGTNLPAGTELRLTAAADGAVQRFHGDSLADYRDLSAFFNGDTVTVELVAAPGTRGNRARVVAIEAGDPPAAGVPTTICGPIDRRALSQDARQGRQHPTGCTSWLISAATVLTAGHCTSATTANQIHFNVPLSTSGGGLVLPHPDDQYPYDLSTQQRLSGGVGQDWTVVTTVRNSNTRLYPGQKQGSWYELGSIPAVSATIRITGYGTTGSGVDRRWNQVQKTHTGPLSQIGGTSLCYATDTTGGNSGSPIVDEATGRAVGIHTHGGCTSSGSGCNSGTRIDRSDLRAAITALIDRKKAGWWQPYGSGCAGSAGTPELRNTGFPDLGRATTLTLVNAPTGPAALVLGGSSTTWGGTPLPLDLAPLGAAGCALRASPDVALPMVPGSGGPSFTFTVPSSVALVGAEFFAQATAGDAAANALGLVFSQGMRGRIGD